MLKRITSSVLSLIIIILSVQNNVLAVSTTEKNKKTVDLQIKRDNGINYSLSDAGAFDPEYVYTIQVTPGYYAVKRDYMSEKAKFLPTLQLLDYFLESVVLPGYVYPQSIPNEMTHDNYSCHKEYVELISRNDLITALEAYAQKLSEKSENESFTQVAFERVLKQTEINRILTETFQTDVLYPNLFDIYSDISVEPLATGDYIGIIGNIKYYSCGTIKNS